MAAGYQLAMRLVTILHHYCQSRLKKAQTGHHFLNKQATVLHLPQPSLLKLFILFTFRDKSPIELPYFWEVIGNPRTRIGRSQHRQ